VVYELRFTVVKSLSVNPADPLSVAVNSNLGVSAFRVENEKFKVIALKFVVADSKLFYLDVQYVQVDKLTSVLLVLDNNNEATIFDGSTIKLIDKIYLQDEFSNLNRE